MADMEVEQQPAIDETLYSRQLYVMGREGQARMACSDVLIVGLNGLGVEIAKNVILAGVKSVTLDDPTPTSFMDLSAQFYLSDNDLGKPRAEACVSKLAELNPYVKVHVSSEDLSPAFLQRFSTVVMVNQSLESQLEVNEFCHAHNKQFISTDVSGLFGFAFCDFGEAFTVSDINGEPATSCIVASITQANPALVSVLDDQRHNLETGDIVAFDGVGGMEELNGVEFRVTVKDPFSFEIECDTSTMPPYTTGGYVNQVKQPETINFKPLRQALTEPGEFVLSDFAKFDRPGILHQAFRALHEWRAQHSGQSPTPGRTADAQQVYDLMKSINQSASEGEFRLEEAALNECEELVHSFAKTAAGVVNPMCAFLGGVVGQEVLKACSGKFAPIQQWFYFDASEALPSPALSEQEVAPRGCRYDGQIAIFGQELQSKIENLNYFLVGAGAIGCEMLKNWSLMGLASGPNGMVHVTDMDTIEKSNLSRQFLFRNSDIGSLKSRAAASAVRRMNSDIKITCHESRVGPDTESVFNDEFFESLSGVCNALDNIEARLYMDQRCLFYQLPLLESGTLGTKGNTQMVVPHLTENYGATRDPPEKSIPVCTLKNFPNQIEHTLQWARDWFEGTFKQTPDDVNNYLSEPDYMTQLQAQQNTKLDTLKRIKSSLVDERPIKFEDCITFARLRFEESFSNSIRQLLHNFPLDQVTAAGQPFWSGSKRPPTPLTFDAADPLHLQYIKACANLRASNFGIKGTWDDAFFLNFLPQVMVPEFVPKEGVKISANEKEEEAKQKEETELMDVDTLCQRLVDELPPASSLAGFQVIPVDFDKDIDEHMLFVTACSNLRACNYKIPEADMHRSRLIAGKIIPAIATTTALVTGLVCLELFKIIQGKPLEALKNGFVNLAIPIFAFSEPQPPARTVAKLMKNDEPSEWAWTAWDKLDIHGDLTLKELIAHMEDNYGLDVTMVSHGVSILYSFFQSKSKTKERMPMPMSKIVEAVTHKEIPASQKYMILEIMCSSDEEDEVDLPCVRVILR